MGVSVGVRGAYRRVVESSAPGCVPGTVVSWCLHCERVHRSVNQVECPYCSASILDQWLYREIAYKLDHWPAIAPPDGTRLPLYP